MQPAQRFLTIALAVITVAACDQQKGFDQMKLHVAQVGDVPVSDIVKPPAQAGEIKSWRTDFPGHVFAAVKTDAPCPRLIHTVAGAEFKKDRIELCFTAIPRSEPVPGFACSEEVFVRYEIMGMPADVEPKFAFVGACATSR